MLRDSIACAYSAKTARMAGVGSVGREGATALGREGGGAAGAGAEGAAAAGASGTGATGAAGVADADGAEGALSTEGADRRASSAASFHSVVAIENRAAARTVLRANRSESPAASDASP